MIVNKEKLLNELEAVKPGLSKREIIEQSSCFVFKDGMVMTFNDEIACMKRTCLKPMEGAVTADPLMNLLHKMKEEEIDVGVNRKQEFVVSGKKKRAGIRMEEEVMLEVGAIEKPKKWRDLPDGFMEAVSVVKHCAGSDETQFATTCVHLHPKWIEACDNYQAGRFLIKTGVKSPVLVRRDSLSQIEEAGMEQVSETSTWLHFRNSDKLIMSCRKFKEDFPDISHLFGSKGKPVILPKQLKDAVEKAVVFSSENADSDDIIVLMKKGKLKIKGEGAHGWYIEQKDIKYKGNALKFTVSPKLLVELVHRQDKCYITKTRLRARVGKFTYITALGSVEDE
jgi:DNA polymerase III sliding clamp (beta) subunit (PCNA family)